MPNVTTDKFMPSRGSSGVAQPTTVASSRAIDATTLACTDLSTWATGYTIALITYKADDNDDTKIDQSTLKVFLGVVNNNSIDNLTLTAGSDDGNDVGDIVEMAPTSEMFQRLFEGLTKDHKLDGSHGDIGADSISTGGNGPYIFSTAATQPSAVSGKTVIWLEDIS